MKDARVKPFKLAAWMMGMILILVGSACSADKYLSIDPGSYSVQDNRNQLAGAPGPFVQGIVVDPDTQQLTVILRKGEPLQIPYTPRDRSEWPSGCPGNLYSQRMEVFDLQAAGEALSILDLSDPVLVRNCPDEPYQLILREDGEIGGSVTACPAEIECLRFGKSQNAVEDSCQQLELTVEELDRKKSALESWAQELAAGYGPGVWYFSAMERPVFHHTPDVPTLEGIVEDLNELFLDDQVPTIQVEDQFESTVAVSVSDDQLLTQGMGSSGAQAYLQVVLYSLASLPEVDCVSFQFQEGDHAQPGLICLPGRSQ